MRIPRFHLFEFEDQVWLPALLRQGVTDYLAEITARTRPYAPATESLRHLLSRYPGATVVDLCSGAGGPWPDFAGELRLAETSHALVLTDAFPNLEAVKRFPAGTPVTYQAEPRPAHEVATAPGTIRTLFSSFHHFDEPDARRLLAAAATARAPIAIFEATHRSAKALLAMTLVPIIVLVLTPVIRPVRVWRLFFTYVLPIIPILAWWDGVVSCLRTYSPTELRALAPEIGAMTWEAGELRGKAPLPVTFLIGHPVDDPKERPA